MRMPPPLLINCTTKHGFSVRMRLSPAPNPQYVFRASEIILVFRFLQPVFLACGLAGLPARGCKRGSFGRGKTQSEGLQGAGKKAADEAFPVPGGEPLVLIEIRPSRGQRRRRRAGCLPYSFEVGCQRHDRHIEAGIPFYPTQPVHQLKPDLVGQKKVDVYNPKLLSLVQVVELDALAQAEHRHHQLVVGDRMVFTGLSKRHQGGIGKVRQIDVAAKAFGKALFPGSKCPVFQRPVSIRLKIDDLAHVKLLHTNSRAKKSRGSAWNVETDNIYPAIAVIRHQRSLASLGMTTEEFYEATAHDAYG